jgi:hypothetical protein
VPPTGEARASVLTEYADANGFDLREGVAYADSTSDLPMLEVVGFPVAVNPETRLAALARKRGWLVEHFDKAAGGSAPALPMGPAWKGGGSPGLLTRLLTSDAWGTTRPGGPAPRGGSATRRTAPTAAARTGGRR